VRQVGYLLELYRDARSAKHTIPQKLIFIGIEEIYKIDQKITDTEYLFSRTLLVLACARSSLLHYKTKHFITFSKKAPSIKPHRDTVCAQSSPRSCNIFQ
jgi:hypothetical protein